MSRETRDLMSEYVSDEYEFFPNALHDDMMDCQARIYDLQFFFPKEIKMIEVVRYEEDPLDMKKDSRRSTGWMAQG